MIRLLLNGLEVEATKELDILLNYKFEDVNNPTIVKNMFSKTVSIPSTKKNDNIFGNIYRFDRVQEYSDISSTGVYFDPSKRVPFSVLDDTNILETGYFQLDNIEYSDNTHSYNITLYGGLGNFLYSLMYNEEGENIKLSDLKWDTFFNEEETEISTPGDEFGITVNARNVYNAFNYFPKGDISNWSTQKKQQEGLDIYDWLTFMPSYNGYYDNFDNNKVLVYVDPDNTSDMFSFGNFVSFEDNDEVYSLYKTVEGLNDGYAIAELSKELTEWEIRDLRSYKQRPALRLRRLIETICNPVNNGGYTVHLDSEFFNDNNPYWNDTYIALPLLEKMIEEGETIEKSSRLDVYNVLSFYDSFINSKYNDTFSENIKYLIPKDGDFTVSDNYNWNMAGYPYTSKFNMHYTFNLKCGKTDDTYSFGRANTSSSIAMQLVALEYDTDRVLAYSNIYNFTDPNYPYNFSSNPNTIKRRFYGEDIVNIKGKFVNGVFNESTSNNKLFELTLNEIPMTNGKIKFKINCTKCYQYWGVAFDKLINSNNTMIAVNWISPVTVSSSYAVLKYVSNSNLNRMKLTKEVLFSMDETPADYLLSFTKAFGLNIVSDNTKKEISIVTRNNYFNGGIEDLDGCIDLNKDYNITPLTFSNKWLNMQFETEETKYSKIYDNKYDVKYGMKRINTNYNFNSDEKELLDDNVFRNGVTILDKSEAYYNWMSDDEYRPTIGVNYYQYKLFNGTLGGGLKDSSFYVYPYDTTNKTDENVIGRSRGMDATPKICYFDEELGTSDFANCLVMRNGLKTLKDGSGNWFFYSLTDDIPEMYTLNGNACYLYAYPGSQIYDYEYTTPIEWLSTLPVYTKYKTGIIKDYNYGDEYMNENNTVSHSLDFGSPREMYCEWTNNDNTNLYYKFWKNFIEDQNSVNTRILECYVMFKHKIDASALRKIYYFNNSYWILNEISDYNVSANIPTKCKFIKVNNIDNYTNGQKI